MLDTELSKLIEKARKASENPEAQQRLAEAEAYERDREQEDTRAMLKAVGVPTKTRTAAMGALEVNSALGQVRTWADSRQTLLVVQGDVGVGKSVAAAWWMKQTIQGERASQQTQQRWWCPVEIAEMGLYAQGQSKLADLYRVPSLVIDDIGTEYADAKGYFLTAFVRIVDRRYEEELPTLMTTNMQPAEFRQRYGERIHDRICECGRWISVMGRSYRKRAAGLLDGGATKAGARVAAKSGV